MSDNELNFSIADLEEWFEDGRITPEQITNIRSYIESKGFIEEQNEEEGE